MAAFMAQTPAEEFPRRTTSVRSALRTHLQSVIDNFATPRGRQVTLTMASADPESELAKAFRNQVILKSREAGRRLVERSLASKQLRGDVDVDAVLDMLYGPVFFRLLVGHLPLSTKLAGQLVETLLNGVGLRR